MPPVPESCAKCSKQGSLRRCSKCLSISYCSRECQFADWKSHKKGCQPPEGSDGTKDPSNAIPRNLNPTSPKTESKVILGVKLYSKEYSSNVSSRGPRARFVDEEIALNHPIFTFGELCPLTALYGIPVIIYSSGLDDSGNQPAVYLRIEADNGFAPMHWQMNNPGTCYVVRKDHKPLSKEVVETIYEFHASILGTDYFNDKMCGNTPYEITPMVFQDFSDKYWRKQALKDGADGRD